MATPTRADLFGMFEQGYPTKHALHPQDKQQESSTTETFVPSSIISLSSLKNNSGLHLELDFNNAADALVPTMLEYHQSLSPKAATEPTSPARNVPFAIAITPVTLGVSPPRMQKQPRRAFRKLLNRTFGRLFNVIPITTRISANEPTASHDYGSMRNPLDDFKPHESIKNECFHTSSIVKQGVPLSRNVLTIQDDQQSILSNNSEVPNKWQIFVFVANSEGQEFKVVTQIDSGSPSNFISSATVEKMGGMTVHPIPPEAWKKYSSPVCDARMTPTHFVYVDLWNEKLNLYCRKVKLKILKSDFAQIIIGRGIMQNQEVDFVERLMKLEGDDIPNDGEDVQLMAALLSQNRTEKHKAMDAKRDQIHQQEFRDRQMILAGTLPLPSYDQTIYIGLGSPSCVRDTGQMPASIECRRCHLAPVSSLGTDRDLLAPAQKPNLRWLQFDPPPAQQRTSSKSAVVPDYHTELRRHGTNSSTPGTIHTQYSWGTEGTTSSVSSWNTVGSSTPKRGGPTPPPSGVQKHFQDEIIK